MARIPAICGIELGKDTLSVVHFLPSEETVTGVGIEPLTDSPWPFWKRLQNNMKPLMRDMRANGKGIRGAHAVCSLPAEHAVVTKLLIDSGEEDTTAALRWEMSHHVVGSLDEYACDFEKLPVIRPGPQTAYLAVACRLAWAAKAKALVRDHGLVPRALDVDVLALINAFEANYRDVLSVPTLLVLGGEQYTKVALTWNGSLVDFGFFKFNPDTQDPGAYVEAVRTTIRRLRAANPSLVGQDDTPIYASGVIFTWDKLAAECFSALGDMQVLNPFRNVGCTVLPESSKRQYAPRLGVAVGLAVRESLEMIA